MRHKALAWVIGMALATGVATAGSAELSFNDDNFDAWLTFGIGDDEDAQFLIGGRYLYSTSEDDDASVPGFVAGFSSRSAANEEIRFFLGADAMFGEAQGQDIEGVAVGGGVTWAPEKWNGVFVGARLFYAPGVFCFGDTEGIFEWAGQAGYEINERIRAFVQYSKLSADTEASADAEVDVGLTIGLGFRF